MERYIVDERVVAYWHGFQVDSGMTGVWETSPGDLDLANKLCAYLNSKDACLRLLEKWLEEARNSALEEAAQLCEYELSTYMAIKIRALKEGDDAH